MFIADIWPLEIPTVLGTSGGLTAIVSLRPNDEDFTTNADTGVGSLFRRRSRNGGGQGAWRSIRPDIAIRL